MPRRASDHWFASLRREPLLRFQCRSAACGWSGLRAPGAAPGGARRRPLVAGALVALVVAAVALGVVAVGADRWMPDSDAETAAAPDTVALRPQIQDTTVQVPPAGWHTVGEALPSDDARQAGHAAGLALRHGCIWGAPGRDPYRGSPEQALQAAGLPADAVRAISQRIRRGESDGEVMLARDGIRSADGQRQFGRRLVASTYGMTLCFDTLVNFAEGHVERAPLFEFTSADGRRFSVIVPDVCGNVGVISEQPPAGIVLGERAERAAHAVAPGAVEMPPSAGMPLQAGPPAAGGAAPAPAPRPGAGGRPASVPPSIGSGGNLPSPRGTEPPTTAPAAPTPPATPGLPPAPPAADPGPGTPAPATAGLPPAPPVTPPQTPKPPAGPTPPAVAQPPATPPALDPGPGTPPPATGGIPPAPPVTPAQPPQPPASPTPPAAAQPPATPPALDPGPGTPPPPTTSGTPPQPPVTPPRPPTGPTPPAPPGPPSTLPPGGPGPGTPTPEDTTPPAPPPPMPPRPPGSPTQPEPPVALPPPPILPELPELPPPSYPPTWPPPVEPPSVVDRPSFDPEPTRSVPAPGTLSTGLLGLAALMLSRRWRRRRQR